MLGRSPKLDVTTPQAEMITGRRGGYCFKQNMLFREALRSLGRRRARRINIKM
jgi:N-hydroxyarylamine O-acetyltransferase